MLDLIPKDFKKSFFFIFLNQALLVDNVLVGHHILALFEKKKTTGKHAKL